MPRYFFDVHDGQNTIDEIGLDLPDFEAAKGEALKRAADFVATPKSNDGSGGALIIITRDAAHIMLLTTRIVLSLETHLRLAAKPL